MKRLIFFLSLLLCAVGAQAQVSSNDLVVVGYVTTNSNNPSGVPNWPVYYSTDNGLTFPVTYTDQNGFFSLLIENGSVLGDNQGFPFYTYSCDSTET